MDMLTLKDRIDAQEYRSDRAAAVPFTPLVKAMKVAQDVMTASEDEWAGVVTPSCSDHSETIVVEREVGVGLRIGGEAHLCFTCGPNGGHYHPADGQDIMSVSRVARFLSNIVKNR